MPTTFEQRCIKTTIPESKTVYFFEPIKINNDAGRKQLSHYKSFRTFFFCLSKQPFALPALPGELWLMILGRFLPDLVLIEIIPSPQDTSLDIPQEIHGHRVVKITGHINEVICIQQNPTPDQGLPAITHTPTIWESNSLCRPFPSSPVITAQPIVDDTFLESFPKGSYYLNDLKGITRAYQYNRPLEPENLTDHFDKIADTLYPEAPRHCTIPNGIKEISAYCFAHTPIRSNPDSGTLQFPPSIHTLGQHLFYGAPHLTSVDLSSTKVKYIPTSAFELCHDLEHVILPETVTKIEPHAFENCTTLTTINLEHVKTFDEHAFYWCINLQEVGLRNARDINHCAFLYAACQTLKPGENLEDFAFLLSKNDFTFKNTMVPSIDTADSWINASEGIFPISMLMKLNREHMMVMGVSTEKIGALLKEKERALQIHGIFSSPPGDSAEATTVPQSGMLP